MGQKDFSGAELLALHLAHPRSIPGTTPASPSVPPGVSPYATPGAAPNPKKQKRREELENCRGHRKGGSLAREWDVGKTVMGHCELVGQQGLRMRPRAGELLRREPEGRGSTEASAGGGSGIQERTRDQEEGGNWGQVRVVDGAGAWLRR